MHFNKAEHQDFGKSKSSAVGKESSSFCDPNFLINTQACLWSISAKKTLNVEVCLWKSGGWRKSRQSINKSSNATTIPGIVEVFSPAPKYSPGSILHSLNSDQGILNAPLGWFQGNARQLDISQRPSTALLLSIMFVKQGLSLKVFYIKASRVSITKHRSLFIHTEAEYTGLHSSTVIWQAYNCWAF